KPIRSRTDYYSTELFALAASHWKGSAVTRSFRTVPGGNASALRSCMIVQTCSGVSRQATLFPFHAGSRAVGDWEVYPGYGADASFSLAHAHPARSPALSSSTRNLMSRC